MPAAGPARVSEEEPTLKFRLLLAALVVSLPASLLVAPAAQAREGVDVTWPGLTSFNPEVRDYTFEVSYAGGEQLYAWFTSYGQNEKVPIASTGDVTMTFGDVDGLRGPVLVGTCDADVPCAVLASSPDVTVVRSARLSWLLPGGRRPVLSPQQPELRLRTFPRDIDLVAAYTVERGGSVVASGSLPVVRHGEEDVLSLADAVPAFEKAGFHSLYVTLSGESSDYGQLTSGRYSQGLDWDDSVKLVPALDHSVLHPVKDGYRDVATLRVRSEDLRELVVDVLDAEGEVVKRVYGPVGVVNGGDATRFDGRVGGALVAAGDYSWQLRATDLVGNTTVASVPFEVSHEAVRTAHWSRTFRAASTVVDNSVGSCSKLKESRKGRLGYYSQTSCSRADDSAVVTLNRAYVPRSFTDRWSRLRLATTGGGAGRGDYLVVYNRDTSGEDRQRLELDARQGKHRGKVIDKLVRDYIHGADTGGRPYVLWLTGLTNGSRYDVKSFTVEVTRTVLR